ncbi:MAG: hypothetical protein JW829_14210 [Pirellulales bacterium]|nr:hypothetical protein [Pirellulales bacterium]
MLTRFTYSALALVLAFSLAEQGRTQDFDITTRAPSSSSYQSIIKDRDLPTYNLKRTIANDINAGQALFGRSIKNVTGSVTPERVNKPFTYVTQQPTVSPYLNLLREDLTGEAAPNYYSLVKPQLDQINFNAQQMRQNQLMARRIQGIQSQSAFPVSGSQYLIPTGHPFAYMNYLHYYSMPRRR